MFTAGMELKAIHGADKVFDLSIGNPVIEPPAPFFEVLADLSRRRDEGLHRYMPNGGFTHVREAVAAKLKREDVFDTPWANVILTVGAAGALNTTLKTILNPGDEVLILTPYFVEYISYVENHGGKAVLVKTADDFDMDLGEIEKSITPRTRAIILNSPNNPTGRIYPRATLDGLADLLMRRQKELGSSIYILSDEPYRELFYGEEQPRSIVSLYPNSFLIYSWSKSLSIPGERIGFVAAHPDIDDPRMADGLTVANRTLGFVNAPASMQLAIAGLLDITVDVSDYRRRRDLFVTGLEKAGYDFQAPEGTFYIFPKSPIADDVAFAALAQEELVLVVPGTGFGQPGYFRLCFCVDDITVEGGIAALARTMAKL